MKRALVRDGVVVEILSAVEGFPFEACFPPEIVEAAHPCPDDVEQGWLYAEGAFAPPPALAIDLDVLKADLKAAIDAGAERERLRYITGGAGQAMTYARKVEEAKAVQAADEPDPADYPMLAASIGIDGEDIETVAATVLAMDAAWAQIGAAIEAARLTAKRLIDEAETVEAAQAVAPAWPQP